VTFGISLPERYDCAPVISPGGWPALEFFFDFSNRLDSAVDSTTPVVHYSVLDRTEERLGESAAESAAERNAT
jgi:hypothetical protein